MAARGDRLYRSRTLLALTLIAVGVVWIGQGFGWLTGGSFMVGDYRWAVAGMIIAVAGLAIGIRAYRRRRG
jgi:hypothetical protein